MVPVARPGCGGLKSGCGGPSAGRPVTGLCAPAGHKPALCLASAISLARAAVMQQIGGTGPPRPPPCEAARQEPDDDRFSLVPDALAPIGLAAAAQAGAGVTYAALNFLKPMTGRLYSYQYEPPTGVALRNGEDEPHLVAIRDARPLAVDLSLDAEGFALLQAPTAFASFNDAAAIRTAYYAEVEQLLGAGDRRAARDRLRP